MEKLNNNDIKALVEIIKITPLLTSFAKTPNVKRHYEDVIERLNKILRVLNSAVVRRPQPSLFNLIEDDVVSTIVKRFNHG